MHLFPQSWAKTKPEFVSNVSVRHVATGKYLAVSVSNGLTLSDKLNETCIFGYWKRQGGIFGMQSRYSRKWAGQSLLGKLSCNANAFGRREEWDADGEWSETSLLCASAGWGNGGYLLATPDRDTVVVGGGGLVDKKQADQWCIAETGA
uniref:Uncharacterized protein n=1 Tax=Craspedostauros australis TaxID=1486917 RepID=A0A7R9ZPU6_9STRA|mmetsp:Transcript_5099/g.13657  ORF Transcript_5099/g.13657 Transcript_5099/m.13657 type:complete len:149 (+) Transcript_5099:262-708(+)